MPYEFNDKELEIIAITHPSKVKNPQFQRLEFLGDRLISETLVKWVMKNKFYNEKQMSQWLSALVCHQTMYKIGQFLVPKISYTGHLTSNVIADVLEAWIGAIYLDNGNYHKVILELWNDLLDQGYETNYKNLLQEYCHKNKFTLDLIYSPCDQGFICEITCISKINRTKHSYKIIGESKKQASLKASEYVYKKLQKSTTH